MIQLLQSATKELAFFLEKELPKLSPSDWWQTRVLNRLTVPQQKETAQRDIASLKQLDLASLLRVMDQNLNELSEAMRWPRDARHWVKELQTVRNRWAHSSSEDPLADDVYRDADTLLRVLRLIGADVVERVAAEKERVLSPTVAPAPKPSSPPRPAGPATLTDIVAPGPGAVADAGIAMQSSFARLIHADWSTTRAKRWAVGATKNQGTWIVDAPRVVGPVGDFVKSLLQEPYPTLAGFDFPIGVPAAFGKRTGFGVFLEALDGFGAGGWSDFYHVCRRADDISLNRPFYPNAGNGFPTQRHLVEALGVSDMNALVRQCERKTASRPAACSLFWTLGANQVGKAAISGWQEVIQPARKAGARLWPFDGTLAQLCGRSHLVICETYPREAYDHVSVRFPPGVGKALQSGRRTAAAGLPSRCKDNGIVLSDPMLAAVEEGFDGDDQFDAAMGLLGMIEVVEGRRPESSPAMQHPEWEGWILGHAYQ